MKLSLLTCFVFVSVLALGQKNISEVTSASKVATIELQYIYDLNVFAYFKINDYDTELKKSVFLKTEEGQNKLNELKSLKADMLKTVYYARLSGKFENDYDIEKKGFTIVLGINFAFASSTAPTPKAIYFDKSDMEKGGILLKALPTKKTDITKEFNTYRTNKVEGGLYEESLFISMSEESALEVENDKENTDIYFFFTPQGREQTVFKVFSNEWHEITRNMLKADKVRVVVANKSSGKILSDKTFSNQVPGTKK